MAGKIQFFQFNQKLFRFVGFRPLKSQDSPYASYNWQNLTVLLLHLILFAVTAAFFLFEAHSYAEFGGSFMLCTSLLVLVVNLSIIIPKSADIYILMEKCEEFIEQSKRNPNIHNNKHKNEVKLFKKRNFYAIS